MKNLIALVLFALSFPLIAQDSPIERIKKIIISEDKDVKTDAVIIYKDGKRLFEYYGRGYTADSQHLSWSMAKSIAGILVGQAIHEGRLKLNDKISHYLPQVKTEATILNVLNMSSNIAFKEEYDGVPVNSDATGMLYLTGPKKGFANYVASLPERQDAKPGDHFYYSSGDTNLLMAALQKSYNDQAAYDRLPFEKFFGPLGIQNATFEQDSAGTFIGSSYVYLSANDFLKVGQLLNQDGQWNGNEIIPSEFMKLMRTLAPGVELRDLDGGKNAYSAQINTNLPIPTRNLPSPNPDLPVDSLLLWGHQGQFLVASKSENLVLLRLGTDAGGWAIDDGAFFAAVKDLLKEQSTYTTARDLNPEAYGNHHEKKAKFTDYLKVPQLIRSLGVKEFCSCHLVLGRSKKACREDLKATLPVLPLFFVSKDKKTVRALLGLGILGQLSVAEYKGKELGCTLTKSR